MIGQWSELTPITAFLYIATGSRKYLVCSPIVPKICENFRNSTRERTDIDNKTKIERKLWRCKSFIKSFEYSFARYLEYFKGKLGRKNLIPGLISFQLGYTSVYL